MPSTKENAEISPSLAYAECTDAAKSLTLRDSKLHSRRRHSASTSTLAAVTHLVRRVESGVKQHQVVVVIVENHTLLISASRCNGPSE